jgi:hypothetical protein
MMSTAQYRLGMCTTVFGSIALYAWLAYAVAHLAGRYVALGVAVAAYEAAFVCIVNYYTWLDKTHHDSKAAPMASRQSRTTGSLIAVGAAGLGAAYGMWKHAPAVATLVLLAGVLIAAQLHRSVAVIQTTAEGPARVRRHRWNLDDRARPLVSMWLQVAMAPVLASVVTIVFWNDWLTGPLWVGVSAIAVPLAAVKIRRLVAVQE